MVRAAYAVGASGEAGLRPAQPPRAKSRQTCRSRGLARAAPAPRTPEPEWAPARRGAHGGTRGSPVMSGSCEQLADRRQRAPREDDPASRPPPHVFALDRRVRLLVEDGRAHLRHLSRAEVAHDPERPAGICDVVGDTAGSLAAVDELR